MQVTANGINIEVEDYGKSSDPAILLIMGFSAQLVYWPLDLVNGLVESGFRVIRFDNRDVGLSHKFDGHDAPGPIKQILAKKFFPRRNLAPYDLHDMAQDAVGVLDALEIDKAHIVGASMGGMIGQLVAANHAERVHSFTPIMSSTNAPDLPGANPEVRKVLFRAARARARNPEEALKSGIAFSTIIASDEGRARTEERKELLQTAIDRCFYPPGTRRQMAAIIQTGNLRPLTQKISAPTMVIHGADDPLIPHSCGADIAANVNDASFQLVEGMGHDLPPSKLPQMVELIAGHCRAA